jgi:hypothetical protein
MKTFILLIVSGLLAVIVVGCGSSGGGSQGTTSMVIYPPGKPAVVRTSATTAALTWEASTAEAVAGYYVYRGTTTEGSGLSNISSTAFSVKTYSDSGLTAAQGYYYAVCAITATQEGQKSTATYMEPHCADLPITISRVK